MVLPLRATQTLTLSWSSIMMNINITDMKPVFQYTKFKDDLLFVLIWFIASLLPEFSSVYASTDPLAVADNKYGIHIISATVV